MPFILIETDAEHVAGITVMPADPRDGPASCDVLASGTARECLLVAAAVCSTNELHAVRVHGLHRVQLKRMGIEPKGSPQPDH